MEQSKRDESQIERDNKKATERSINKGIGNMNDISSVMAFAPGVISEEDSSDVLNLDSAREEPPNALLSKKVNPTEPCVQSIDQLF